MGYFTLSNGEKLYYEDTGKGGHGARCGRGLLLAVQAEEFAREVVKVLEEE